MPPEKDTTKDADELAREVAERDGDDSVHEVTDGDPSLSVEDDPEVADA